jgi:hypothetical protein
MPLLDGHAVVMMQVCAVRFVWCVSFLVSYCWSLNTEFEDGRIEDAPAG